MGSACGTHWSIILGRRMFRKRSLERSDKLEDGKETEWEFRLIPSASGWRMVVACCEYDGETSGFI
jgi:hypothetical protein